MKLSRVRIVNFRNFADLTIDPFPTPAVIVGENGVGKTNLLHALRLVLDPDLPDRARRLEAEDVHEGSLTTLAIGTEVRVETDFVGFDGDPDARAQLDGAIISKTPPLRARLTYLWRPRTALGVVLGAAPEPLTPGDYEWLIFGGATESSDMRAAKEYMPLSVLPALRNVEADLGRPDRSPLTRLLRELPPDELAIDAALAAMEKAREGLANDANVKQVATRLRRRVEELAGPRLGLDPTLAFTSGRREDLVRSVRLFVDAAKSRGVDRTSTGTANVLYLALLLELLAVRRADSAGEDTLLAVEEPEAHLHPGLQRRVFADLLRQPNRLLLTTHSPHIAAVTPLSSLVLTADDGGATTGRVVPPGLFSAVETADLERYLNVTRAELLFARYVILVEGAAEEYLLPAFAEAAGLNLDSYGIVVANVDGTDFSPYVRLLNALGQPCWVLTDGDVTDAGTPWRGEPGLSRAHRLAFDTEKSVFGAALQALFKQPLPASGEREGRDDLIATAERARIFIGRFTLESDLAALLPDEMCAAFNELRTGATRRSRFRDDLTACADGRADADDRDRFVGRIEEVGKGRYAQRLAGHVKQVDLRGRLSDILEWEDDGSEFRPDDYDAVPAGMLLRLLDDVARVAAGRALLRDVPVDTDDDPDED